MAKPIRRVYSFAQIADAYRAAVERGDTLGPCMDEYLPWWIENKGDNYGGTSEDVLNYLATGFEPEPNRQAPVIVSGFEGQANAWKFNDEEGDYEHDLFISGEPEFYLDRLVTPGKPGINIRVELGFTFDTKPQVIGDFGQWVAEVLRGIAGLGFDVSLTVYDRGTGAYGNRQMQETAIVVKRFGEAIVPRDLLILFSPPGYRHLFFTALMYEEKNGLRTWTGLNTPAADAAWAVGWDPDTRVLEITSDRHPTRFPIERMNAMLAEVRDEF